MMADSPEAEPAPAAETETAAQPVPAAETAPVVETETAAEPSPAAETAQAAETAPAAETAQAAETAPAAETETTTTTTTTADLSGTWLLDRNENFEAFLSANGVNWLFRKMASRSKPKSEITQDGDKFFIKMVTAMKTMVDEFTVGKKYEQESHSGAKMEVHTSWDGARLVMRSVPLKEGAAKEQTISREIVNGELVVTLQVEDVTATRIFKRAP